MSPNRILTLFINGNHVSGTAGETILQVARENDIEIPTLCNLDGLTSTGACRICLLEVKGSNKLLPACATQIREGMEVTTESERLLKYRRMILELIFSRTQPYLFSVCFQRPLRFTVHGPEARCGSYQLQLPQPPTSGRRVPSPICHGSQSMHPVHPLHPCL